MKQAIILAGGKGTRLRERLAGLPKPLIDICGVPLLERQILLLKQYDFEKILILVNYQAEMIAKYCADHENWGLSIECIDDGEPRGTAGAVLQVLNKLEEEFLVVYGDTMLEVDLDRFHDFHRMGKGVSASLFLHPNDHPQDSDLVETNEDDEIVRFYPYPHPKNHYYPNLVNAALYWINKSSLKSWEFCHGMVDFGKDLFPKMIAQGLRLRGYNSPEYIKDCGTPARVDKVCEDFMSGRITRSSLGVPQSIVFVDRDGTLNKEVDHLKNAEQFELFPNVEQSIRSLNRAEYRVCVVTNQPVLARGDCTNSELKSIHNKFETLLGREGAFVDRIYYCPHHPDKGFKGEIAELKIYCNCRKPNTGLFDLAKTELNASFNNSWMIGDSTSDILAAKNVGLKSILVETGYAGMDNKYWAIPDYIVPNFADAVDFILNKHPLMKNIAASIIPSFAFSRFIFVGGQSRSGKSTFASIIKELMLDSGKRCHIISTDRWLLPESMRSDGIFGRHDLLGLNQILTDLLTYNQKWKIDLPGYNKLSRESVTSVDFLEVERDDIFIFEGVIALLLPLSNRHPRIFTTIDEKFRHKRVLNEYKLRGYNLQEAESIYQLRMSDEFRTIELAKSNSILIDMDSINKGNSNDH